MTPRRLAVWCVVVLLLAVPAARFARRSLDAAPHHASLKSARSSPGDWRTATVAPGLEALIPVLVARRADSLARSERLAVVAPAVPFHPPRA